MKFNLHISLTRLWLAWFLAGPATAFGQGTFVYQQWINPSPRPNVPWDDSGVWVRNSYPVGTPLNIDMDLDGTPDFKVFADPAHLYVVATGSGEILSLQSPPPDLGGFAKVVAPGESLNPIPAAPFTWMRTLIGQDGATMLYSVPTGTLGFWGGQFGYLGVRIWKNDAWNYGWIRGGVPLSIVPEGIFYEAALNLNPNAGIFAGQVPEPSPWALFALGAAMLARVRAKRIVRVR